jgi:hypothetical protein
MRYLNTFFTLLFLIFLNNNAEAQKNFMAGDWSAFSTPYHAENPSGNIIVDSFGEARWVHSEGFALSEIRKEYTGCNPEQKSLSNYSSFTLALTIECANTDTVQTYNLSTLSIGNPHYFLGFGDFLKSLKNNSNLDINCFQQGDCRYRESVNYYLRRKAKRTVLEDDIFVGSATNDDIEFEEVRFTDQTLEIVLMFKEMPNDYTGTLNPPGSDNAFFIRDEFGNRYNLISQQGWGGQEKKGYGSYVIEAETENHILLFFEPVNNYQNVNNLSLIEGVCESGCWNFYDVRLKDQN